MKFIAPEFFGFLFLAFVSIHGQENNFSYKPDNFFDKFGYHISLLNLNKFDSNVLKYSSGGSDFSSAVYPSASITYHFSVNTKFTAQYLFGLEKYASTSFLNTDNHRVEARLTQYFSSGLSALVSGYYQNSNQPDLLTTRSTAYHFATFDQYSTSFKLIWLVSSRTLYSFEYSFIQRNYSRMLTLSLNKQRDNYNFIAVGWTHQLNTATIAGVKFGFINSSSNNQFYNFSRQFLDLYLSHNIGAGFKVQAEDIISSLGFSSRTLTNDPSTTRSDVINTLTIGLRKNLTKNIAADLSYYFQKDFSNEPIRQFSSHTVYLGFEFAIGSDNFNSLPRYSNTADLENGAGINKEAAAAEQLTNAGYQYLLKGNYEKSLEFSLKAISLDNDIEQAHINAGIAFYKKGDKEQAAEQWKSALKLNPKNDKLRILIKKIEAEIKQSR